MVGSQGQTAPQLVGNVCETHRVLISNLILPARIGVYNHEKSSQQRIRLNIELLVRKNVKVLDDDINNVVSYEDIVNGIKSILSGDHINLVETLAEKISVFCLMDERVSKVRIRVEKLQAISEAESVGIEIEKKRICQ